MLLFQGGLFLISLLTLIVAIVDKIIKNSSPTAIWMLLIFITSKI
ncbi:putative holin-like toxin [uncultured Clostridium sp.]|nr:putative holin-like toxin [uncultured Clostridium sp.]